MRGVKAVILFLVMMSQFSKILLFTAVVSQASQNKATPLHIAAFGGDTNAIKALLASGAEDEDCCDERYSSC